MANSLYYLELCDNPIRFDAANQLTDVFFDDCNKQVFSVRSNGSTGIVVKGPKNNVKSFCVKDRGIINSIKFSLDNQILAIQRGGKSVDFYYFVQGELETENILTFQCKVLIYGLVWIQDRECVIFSKDGIETLHITDECRQIRPIKSLFMDIQWFVWCSDANIAILGSTEENVLIPVLFKKRTITRLPKLVCDPSYEVQEKKVTIGKIYGSIAVLILHTKAPGAMEIAVHLLIGPGLAPRKCHVLRLEQLGPFAINIVDNLIVVHHQSSATSLLFDVALSGETVNGVTYHNAIVPGASIRPFTLKIPSISPNGENYECELYSTHWVVFQPDIVIDAKLGCLWNLNLCIEPLCSLISNSIRLTEFLLQRESGKKVLLDVLYAFLSQPYKISLLPTLEIIFNKINSAYLSWIQSDLATQTAQQSNNKGTAASSTASMPSICKTIITQNDMYSAVLKPIAQQPHTESIISLYLQSLSKFNIIAQEELSKFVINEFISNASYDSLERLINHSFLMKSNAVACCLLSQSNIDKRISQIAIDMLKNNMENDVSHYLRRL